jgi:hypothetical protein
MELFAKEKKSATDLRDLAFLLRYTTDHTTTFEVIENLGSDEFTKLLGSASVEPVKPNG